MHISRLFPSFSLKHLGYAALPFILGAASQLWAQDLATNRANHAWQARAIAHAQRMRAFHDYDSGRQITPRVIPRHELDLDPSGVMATFHPNGPTVTDDNAFFQNLGTNGRTCLTCHQPKEGWGISADGVKARFLLSAGSDPIFRLVDGANCPTANVSTIGAKVKAYSQLLSKGLIRIGLPIPAGAEFSIAVQNDSFGCNTDSRTGLATGIVSIYRRPLPSTNLGFLGVGFPISSDARLNPTIMWDGREPSLESQAIDATLGHAQASVAPNDAQVTGIVNFETDLFTAQAFDRHAWSLNGPLGAKGGPIPLQQQLTQFYPGINDPIGLNPKGTPFTSVVFGAYATWEGLLENSHSSARPTAANAQSGNGRLKDRLTSDQAAVARGESVFNNTQITITNVGGLNDALNLPTIQGFCATCHDSPNVGNHSTKMPLNIGVANAPADLPAGTLDAAGLPIFLLTCNSGPLSGHTYTTTDPGRALISGKCVDISKTKGPILRGLAGRAPYFHNGSAATLVDVVKFYDARFSIGFTDQQKQDLVAFLKTL